MDVFLVRCRHCATSFEPTRPLQAVCSWRCAAAWAQTERARRAEREARRREKREFREKNMGVPQATKKAQSAFNSFIRARDHDLPCISCGAPPAENRRGGTRDAGHFLSVGTAPHMRFIEDNCHAQCKRCNRDLSGNAVRYRQGLIERIGIERVEWLEGPHPVRQYRVPELREIEAHYRRETRKLRDSRRRIA